MRKPLICLQPCNYKYALTKQHLRTDLNKPNSHIKVVVQKKKKACVCGNTEQVKLCASCFEGGGWLCLFFVLLPLQTA